MQPFLKPLQKRPKPKRWGGPGLRRWTLAVLDYCQVCRKRTSQAAAHELEGGWHIVTQECVVCHQGTSRSRTPIGPREAPPLSQLRLDDLC